MAPTKLTESDKQDILARYRQPEETTSTLASRYGVSNSTISRILKQNLSDEEYEILVQQKRSGMARGTVVQPNLLEVDPPKLRVSPNVVEAEVVETEVVETEVVEAEVVEMQSLEAELSEAELSEAELSEAEGTTGQRRRRKRSTAVSLPTPAISEAINLDKAESKPLPKVVRPEPKPKVTKPEPRLKADIPASDDEVVTELVKETERRPADLQNQDYVAQTSAIEEILEEELIDDEEDFDEIEDEAESDDDLDDDLDDDDLEELDQDEVSVNRMGDYASVHVHHDGVRIQVLPLSEAALPKTCYVVIDRSSELITRPLKDFADLGQIPTEETLEKTLPIFDNHRVAKRFLRRMQRVVKVPDGRVFHKVTPYLQAKGITRLLIDGQVYSLN